MSKKTISYIILLSSSLTSSEKVCTRAQITCMKIPIEIKLSFATL